MTSNAMMIKYSNGIIKNAVSALITAVLLLSLSSTISADDAASTRKERNYIRSGNSLYEQGRYNEAEVEYKKALETNPASEVATYNLALALLNQSRGNEDPNDKDNPVSQASDLLSKLAPSTGDTGLASRAYYNLGNIAYNQKQYDKSIEMYKACLRRNPDDDDARENLRLAQKKQQEQQDQQQDQQQDKQDQDKDKDQQQDKQDQQDKQNEQDQQDKQDRQDQQQNQNQQQQPQQQSMSQENIDQILKAMQDAEQNTQQRVKEKEAKEEKARIQTDKNW